jgi:hypothetical protein
MFLSQRLTRRIDALQSNDEFCQLNRGLAWIAIPSMVTFSPSYQR